ncbi:terpenoid synthase [Aspergillus eucalypticola CBS 122712]|uniref:Terpenoid synthase n=1 Tax=Aspergillus eucalypticola (strain CBS 122712 / IBT 29274) TaxID=1448314 RepID=A0A317VTZ6_ASPEC|nr:terpenoid synthase [Aspergillus eucalypticola CBS 122712]PWY77813.1 terpenoid synthase [Aspergillus eucalypticola CBS 122712]
MSRTFLRHSRVQRLGFLSWIPTLNTPQCRRFTQRPRLGDSTPIYYPRPISYAFDPATLESQSSSTSPAFSFLRPPNLAQDAEYQHAISLNPQNLKVPWPTSLPCALQSKYWREAEAATKDLLQTLFPPNNNPKGEKYITAVTEGAVSYAIHLFPLCDLARIKLFSRTLVLAFLHDDAVDAGNLNNDVVLIPTEKSSKPSHKAFNVISEEVLAANPVNGAILIEDILSWGSTSRNHQQGPTRFSSLNEYIAHGLEDFGATLTLRCVEFSIADSRSSSLTDVQSIGYLKSLCAKHLLLTNDLYSYAKEVASGDTGLNAVQVVQDLMGGSDSSAKMMVRIMLRDLERQMDEEYTRLITTGSTNITETQLKHARAMIIAVAGNMFFSATCDRYARAVEGSKLV